MNRKILILFAHPRPERSEVQRSMARAAQKLDFVTMVDLYGKYPRFDIDVDAEQQRLLDHDIIIFQHPVYWYSCPAILKEWQDLVLEYGFAYGSRGNALNGKVFLNAVSCGARREVYHKDGAYQNELRELFAPFEQTAKLCGMSFLPPFAVFAAGHAREENRLDQHITDYIILLENLAANTVDLKRAQSEATLSDHLQDLLQSGGTA